MAEEFNVEATLNVRVQRALGRMRSAARAMDGLGRRLRGVNRAADQSFNRLVRFGAAVIGVRLLGGAIRAMTQNLFAFDVAAEDAQLSIATVLQVGGRAETFAQAMDMAADSFDRLRVLAIATPATPFDLTKIYQGALAFSRAGVELEEIERLSQRASIAAGALGVDFDQASRDIAAMASGVAGTDVKLFRMLRNTGALTVSTRQWNELVSSDAPAAFRVLQEALARFDDASVAVGQSWQGVTSTLQGIGQTLGQTARAPVFNQLKQSLRNVAVTAIADFDRLNAVFERMGQAILRYVGPAIRYVEVRVIKLIENIDQLPAKMAEFATKAREVADFLAKGIALKFAVSAGLAIAGTGLSVLASLPAVFSGIASIGGAAAAAMTGIGAAMAGIVPMLIGAMSSIFLFLTSGGVMTAVIGAIGTAIAFAIPIMLALVVAFAAIAIPAALLGGALYVLLTDFRTVVRWFTTNILPTLRNTWDRIAAIFDEIGPELQTFGEVGLFLFGEAIKDVASVVETAVRGIAALLPLMRTALDALGLGALVDVATAQFAAARARSGVQAHLAEFAASREGSDGSGGAERSTGGARSSTVNDFRGSRININQEFRQQDPDRIAVATTRALSAIGERRIASGLAPAVTR